QHEQYPERSGAGECLKPEARLGAQRVGQAAQRKPEPRAEALVLVAAHELRGRQRRWTAEGCPRTPLPPPTRCCGRRAGNRTAPACESAIAARRTAAPPPAPRPGTTDRSACCGRRGRARTASSAASRR